MGPRPRLFFAEQTRATAGYGRPGFSEESLAAAGKLSFPLVIRFVRRDYTQKARL